MIYGDDQGYNLHRISRASLRDDIHELGKIIAVEGNYPGRYVATDLCSRARSPALLPSVHPRHHRFDRVTVVAERMEATSVTRHDHKDQ